MSSMEPYGDLRFIKFRENYTTNEHLMDVTDGLRGIGAINAVGFSAVTSGLAHLDSSVGDLRWATEQGFDRMSEHLAGLQASVEVGFEGMQQVMTWGFARLCWEHEQDREVYRETLDVLRHPLTTQGLELRERAEQAIANHWWDEARDDLQAAIENNRYDYLAHSQLARIMFLEYGDTKGALEHFGLAAKYADKRDASDAERYYAVVALSHVCLIWRLEVTIAGPEATAAPDRALQASRRAYELLPELQLALQEHVLALLLNGRDQQAASVMMDAILADEETILRLNSSPEVRDSVPFHRVTQQWRSAVANHAPGADQLLTDALDLYGSHIGLPPGKLTANVQLVRDRVHAVTPKPRSWLLSQTDFVAELLDYVVEVHKHVIAEAERRLAGYIVHFG